MLFLPVYKKYCSSLGLKTVSSAVTACSLRVTMFGRMSTERPFHGTKRFCLVHFLAPPKNLAPFELHSPFSNVPFFHWWNLRSQKQNEDLLRFLSHNRKKKVSFSATRTTLLSRTNIQHRLCDSHQEDKLSTPIVNFCRDYWNN